MEQPNRASGDEQDQQEEVGESGVEAWRPMAPGKEDRTLGGSTPVKRKKNWPFIFYTENGQMFYNGVSPSAGTPPSVGEARW